MKSTPYICPVCCSEEDNYYGRLVFEDQPLPAYCPNHKAKIELVPSPRARAAFRLRELERVRDLQAV